MIRSEGVARVDCSLTHPPPITIFYSHTIKLHYTTPSNDTVIYHTAPIISYILYRTYYTVTCFLFHHLQYQCGCRGRERERESSDLETKDRLKEEELRERDGEKGGNRCKEGEEERECECGVLEMERIKHN